MSGFLNQTMFPFFSPVTSVNQLNMPPPPTDDMDVDDPPCCTFCGSRNYNYLSRQEMKFKRQVCVFCSSQCKNRFKQNNQ